MLLIEKQKMKEIKLKSQPKWMVRMFILIWVILWGIFAFVSHPIEGTNALNPDWTSDFMHYETVDWIWTISVCDPSSNWEICITMIDKNLWASKSWTLCSSDDTWACGNHYQWWNNYWFDPFTTPMTSKNSVNCRWYTDGRFYNSGIFITFGSDWCYPKNDSIWWYANAFKTNNYWYPVIKPTDRQWPCIDWYHVPNAWERWMLLKFWAANYTGAWSDLVVRGTEPLYYFFNDSMAALQFQDDFKIPFAGCRNEQANVRGVGNRAMLWSSSAYIEDGSAVYDGARSLLLFSGSVRNDVYYERASANSVRCFKDEYLSYPSSVCPEWTHEENWVCTWNAKTVTCLTWNATWVSYDVQEVTITYDTWTETWELIPNCEILWCADWYHSTWILLSYETLDEIGTITICNPNDITKCITMMDKNLWASKSWTVCSSSDNWACWDHYQRWNNHWFTMWCYSMYWCSDDVTRSAVAWAINTEWYWPWNYFIGVKFRKITNNPYDWSSPKNDNLWWWSGDSINNNRWFDTGMMQATNVVDRQWPCPEWYHVPSQWEWWTLVMYWAANYTWVWNSLILQNTAPLNYFSSDTRAASLFRSDFKIPFDGNRYGNDAQVIYVGSFSHLWSSSPDDTKIMYLYMNSSSVLTHLNNLRYDAFPVRCFKDSSLTLSSAVFSCEQNEISGACAETWVPAEHASYNMWITTWIWNSWTNSWDFPACIWNCDEHYHVWVSWNSCDIDTYTITFVDSNWVEADIVRTWEYNSETSWNIDFPLWTKNGYILSWSRDIPDVVPAENIVITAIWTKKQSGWNWWWGWSSLKKDNCPDWDYSDSYYDGTCGKKPNEKDDEKDSSAKPHNDTWTTENDNNKHNSADEIVYDTLTFNPHYSDEMNKAYQYSYHYWITTKNNIRDAAVNQQLTRIAMAKMLSQYAINVLWIKPDATRNNEFADVSDKLDTEYGDWVTLAYQLWIMWINMPNNKFRPYWYVTRAEFATALSRLLYKTSDWEYEMTSKYYVPHINKLAYEWILTNTDPYMKELRGYVMLMLMRTAK